MTFSGDGNANFGDRGRNPGEGNVNFGDRGRNPGSGNVNFGDRGANPGQRGRITLSAAPSGTVLQNSQATSRSQLLNGRRPDQTPASRIVGVDGAGRTLFADSGSAENRASNRIGAETRIPGRRVQITESGGGGSRTPISAIPEQPSGIEIVVAAGSATQANPPPPFQPVGFNLPPDNPCQIFTIRRGVADEPESPEDEDAAGDGGTGANGDPRVNNNAAPSDDPCINSNSGCRWFPVGTPAPPGTVSRGTGGIDGQPAFELFCPNDGVPPAGDAGCDWQSPPPIEEPEPLPSCQMFRIFFEYTRTTVINTLTCATSDNFVQASVDIVAPYNGFQIRLEENIIGNCDLDIVFQSSICDGLGNVIGTTEVSHGVGGNFNCNIPGCGQQVNLVGFVVTNIVPI